MNILYIEQARLQYLDKITKIGHSFYARYTIYWSDLAFTELYTVCSNKKHL